MDPSTYTPFYRKPINWIVLVALSVAGMAFTMAYLEHERTEKLSESRRASYDLLRQLEKKRAEDKAAFLKAIEPDPEADAKVQERVNRILNHPPLR